MILILLLLIIVIAICRTRTTSTSALTPSIALGFLALYKWLRLSLLWLLKSVSFIYFHLISLVNSFPQSRNILELFSKLTGGLRGWYVPVGHAIRLLHPMAVLIIHYKLLILRARGKRHSIMFNKRVWSICLLWLICKVHYFKFKIKKQYSLYLNYV